MPGLNYNEEKQFKLTDEALKHIKESSSDPQMLEQELENSQYIRNSFSDFGGEESLLITMSKANSNQANRPQIPKLPISNLKNPSAEKNILQIPDTVSQRSNNDYAGGHRSAISEMDMSQYSSRSNNKNLFLRKKMQESMHNDSHVLDTSSRLLNYDPDISRSSIARPSNIHGKKSVMSSISGISDFRKDRSSRGWADSLAESVFDVGSESEGFAVHSDLKFLYQIGRI